MPLIKLEEVINKVFDFVIVGGGNAGLVLAARLTEDQDVSVLVLEAGEANLGDPALLRLSQHGSHFGQPSYDWCLKTVPQKFSNGTEFPWPRGKVLGGSSAINFMNWNKPPRDDIDDWERLGNKGWNWDDFHKYSNKSSAFIPRNWSPEEREKRGDALKGWEEPFGDGPIKLSHPKTILEVDIKMQQTLVNMGIPRAPLSLGGDPCGTFLSTNTIDPSSNTRSYAVTGYYTPFADRPNYNVLVTSYVRRIVTSTTDGEITATGVEFTHGQSQEIFTAHAKREVILAAGALKSPQILELSGIGRPEVLGRIGVQVKLALEGVGENVQEHMYTGVSFELKDEVSDETYDLLRIPDIAQRHLELLEKEEGIFTLGIANLTFQPLDALSDKAPKIHKEFKAELQKEIESGKFSSGAKEVLKLQLAKLERKTPFCEIIGFPGFLSFPKPPVPEKKYFTICVALNQMFSKGTVHAISSDPLADPEIDPHYFERDVDLKTFVEMIKFARKVVLNAPVKDYLASPLVEVNPGPAVQSDEEIASWLKGFAGTTYHTTGTLAMLPKENDGVVDTKLKVYGTKNIRVVDLSIVPLQISSHTQVAAYAIAEKAADIIKGKI